MTSRRRRSVRLSLYEHRSEPLLPARAFLRRMMVHGGFAVAVATVALLVGILGYRWTEDLGWVDAFLNAAMILSGMGEIAPLTTTAGKLFAGFYALFSGLVMIATASFLLAPLAHRLIHRLHLDQPSDGDR